MIGTLCLGGALLAHPEASAAKSKPPADKKAAASEQAPAPPMTAEAQRALIDKYCMDCHNYEDYKGGLDEFLRNALIGRRHDF